MTFMDEVIGQNIPIWDACAATPFLRELASGTLPEEKFKRYLIQDSIYLKQYARVFGMAIYRSTHLEEMRLFYSMLSFVTEEESFVRLSDLERFRPTEGGTASLEPLPVNRRYTDFLLRTARRGTSLEILMSVLPCMLSYSYIFRKIAAGQKGGRTKYADFIEDYAEDGYYENCQSWCGAAAQMCQGAAETEKTALRGSFQAASLFELDFWKMAYEVTEE